MLLDKFATWIKVATQKQKITQMLISRNSFRTHFIATYGIKMAFTFWPVESQGPTIWGMCIEPLGAPETLKTRTVDLDFVSVLDSLYSRPSQVLPLAENPGFANTQTWRKFYSIINMEEERIAK